MCFDLPAFKLEMRGSQKSSAARWNFGAAVPLIGFA
jgi:hypothetical protein